MDYKVDMSNSEFKTLIVTEDIFNNEYEYTISYDVVIAFSDFDCDSKSVNRIMKSKPTHKKERFTKTFNERPEYISKNVV